MNDSLARVDGAQGITRAVLVLKLLARQADAGLRLVDLAQAAQLTRPTMHRLLKALVAQGMAVQDAATRRYRLGPLVFELGLAAAHRFNLRDLSTATLADLARVTGDTTFLFVRSGDDAVCINRIQGTYPVQTPALPLGSRQPLGVSAGGLALLAALPAAEQKRIIEAVAPRLGAYGELDADDVRAHCALVAKAGYAHIANRAVPGISALGVPVYGESGLLLAAVTVAATHNRMTDARVREIVPLLRGAAQAIGALLQQ
ncbi:IclR family transcriptional regulator [Achromobacter sp. HNDS-1]|jgi:DNA-binding IclR family transcriptional regulator|uniref:IclR family transcriptional regulator n=1 Tax=Achromobacter sp. HNDS-1 TaxID=3151598 RepID=A0AAU7L5L8_9BURK|nr:IclR family transcriptional regulator [Achromobacter ruhlandii]MCI1836254.1 IclR family transcriptional regulator [Achromobacter ruhlandii]CAB3679927.1 Transcriptional regulator KdgR [Achromobacter ruhlandii]